MCSLFFLYESWYGRERLDAALEKVGTKIPYESLTDPNSYISFDLLVRLVDTLSSESKRPDFARQAGLETASPRALGFLFQLLRALGTPKLCYEQIVRFSSAYNNIGRFEIEQLTSRELRLRYTSTRPEPNTNVCQVRQGQLAGLTTIWGLPPATLVHPRCQAEGDEACIYELSWLPTDRPVLRSLMAALASGSAGGLVLGLPGALGGALLGTLSILAFTFWQQSRQKSAYLALQSQGLSESMAIHLQRYEELLQMNETLEMRVKERTEELERSLEKQRELDRLKTLFFQNVSHELRTPLTLILAPLDSLKRDPSLEEKAHRQLDLARRSAVRLLGLINQLLDLAQLEAGRTRLVLTPVDPALLLKQLVEHARPLATERGIRLEYKGAEHLGPVPLDVDKFETCVLNLLSNALKFTRGRERAEVRLEARLEEGRLLVTVADTGIGIPEPELDKIFERFHQVDGSDERRYGGTGIGLALVREFVHFHQGSISVASRLGEGTTFTLNLPAERSSYPDTPLVEERPVSTEAPLTRRSRMALFIDAPAASPAPLAIEGPRPRLLVADDNADMLSWLCTVLTPEFEVLTALDGNEAYELATTSAPDLVLSDVMMPGRNGHTLVSDLRRHPATARTPILLVTARTDVEHRVEGLEAGADDYVLKPFSFPELLARIRRLLERVAP